MSDKLVDGEKRRRESDIGEPSGKQKTTAGWGKGETDSKAVSRQLVLGNE